MNTPDYFEEMLASYPAEKRELARMVCHRFADGDSTQFFSQLLLVLDVHARYVAQLPQKVVAANADTLATIQDVREEVAMLAKTIETRDVNITNHAAKVNELCKVTQSKCDETVSRIELMLKNLGSQVDTAGVVKKFDESIKGIFLPIHIRASDVAHTISPLVEKLNRAAERAAALWPKRIWLTAWAGSFLVTFTAFGLLLIHLNKRLETSAEQQVAQKIAEVSQVMAYNRDAFRQLAIARIPLQVLRSESTDGVPIPQGFVIIVPDAQSAEMHQHDDHNNGCVFVNSRIPEEQIKTLLTLAATNSNNVK